jgi:cell division protein FtsA
MTEILEGVNTEFLKSGLDDDVHEVVLTGGSSLLPGLEELARRVFNRSVRLGEPGIDGGLSSMVNDPRYSTAIGLIMYGMRVDREPREPSGRFGREEGSGLGRILRWFRRLLPGD